MSKWDKPVTHGQLAALMLLWTVCAVVGALLGWFMGKA